MTGLPSVIRVGPMGPGPASRTGRRSPVATAFRSAPAQKFPSRPVRTATLADGSSSNAANASSRAVAVALSTALRTAGRSMVTITTDPVRVMLTDPSAPDPLDAPGPVIDLFLALARTVIFSWLREGVGDHGSPL